MKKMNLTTHLRTLTPQAFKTATTHPFLRLAGQGQIPSPLLSQWLSQDRLYAQSYIRFIGLLLSKVHLPLTPSSPDKETVEEKITDTLIAALTNIRTELGFFEDVAGEYNLALDVPSSSQNGDGDGDGGGERFGPAPITHAYIDMFMSAGSPGTSLLEGLVVLWATEVCYLNAWRYAGSFLSERAPGAGGGDADGGALREKFIPNWSSREFEAFVERIGGVLDEVAEGVLGGLGEREREGVLGRCEGWWRQVVWLEERFWPGVEGLTS